MTIDSICWEKGSHFNDSKHSCEWFHAEKESVIIACKNCGLKVVVLLPVKDHTKVHLNRWNLSFGLYTFVEDVNTESA